MSAIRPDLPAFQPAAAKPEAARAAQAAFFRAALDQVQARQAAPPPPSAAPTSPATPAETPRISRPGGLLDIRV